MAMRDTLFLLPPGFYDNEQREYCPECAEMWGLLGYFPAIAESLTIQYQSIEKPRADIVARLGDENQNCPTLVLHQDSPRFENCGIVHKNGHDFIDNVRDIGKYYAHRFGTPFPRGS